MNRKQFILDSKSLKIKEILNKDFLEIEILAIAEGENRNKTSFTLESMKKSIPTFYNKFILGYFNVKGDVNNEGNFEEHNSDVKYDKDCEEFYYSYLAPNAEKALGLIRESDKVEIVDVEGKNWIKLTAAILTKYNREAVKHLLKSKNKKKVSVEITIEKFHEENGITIIDEFTLDGITILGTRKNSSKLCEEGIEGASMVLRFLQSELFNTQKKALSFAYQELETESLGENEKQDVINMQDNNANIDNDERGKKPMLTYEQKRELLEARLNELLKKDNESDECCCCYVWVADVDDTHVYYRYEEMYWKAPYTINEEDSNVDISISEATQVTRSWEVFSVETETEETETEEVKEEVVYAETETETETYSADDNQEEVVEDETIEDNKEFSEENTDDCSEDVDNKEEACGTQCSDTSDGEDKEEDETEADCDGKEECSNEDTQEQEAKEDINGEIFGDTKEDTEEFIDNENVYTEYSLTLKNGEEEVTLSCSMSEENYVKLTETLKSIDETTEKIKADYVELESKYNTIILTQKHEQLYAYGEELFTKDECLEADNCETLILEFKEKCFNNEFNSEEEVELYVEDSIAKMVYKQLKNNKSKDFNQQNFSTKIKSNAHVEDNQKVEDSMTKMKNILKI